MVSSRTPGEVRRRNEARPRRVSIVISAPSVKPERFAARGCISASGSARGATEPIDPAGLRSGLILRQHATGCEVERIVSVRTLGRSERHNAVESRSTVRGVKSIGKQARRAWRVGRWARPEHPVFAIDARRRNAGVVGRRAGSRDTQFVEHDPRRGRKRCARPQSAGETTQDLQVGANARRRLDDFSPPQHAAFEIGHGAILFRPLRRRQDHVGQARGLGQEEIAHHEVIERRQTALRYVWHAAPIRPDSIRSRAGRAHRHRDRASRAAHMPNGLDREGLLAPLPTAPPSARGPRHRRAADSQGVDRISDRALARPDRCPAR